MADPVTSPEPQSTQRIESVDIYRGLVMFLMLAEILHLPQVAEAFPDSDLWQFLSFNQSHVAWVGCSLHDMIQPSFSFLVGTALAFSVVKRTLMGQSFLRQAIHAFWRAVVLVFLGIGLRSLGKPQTYYTFEDTLTQIGLGYFFLFLLAHRPRRDQWIALAVILVGYWLAFALYPQPGADFDWKAVGVSENWDHHPTGFASHWDKNSNLAWDFDRWFLNLFPREGNKPFRYNSGGYATLSFIPTLGTMILGLLAGGILRRNVPWGWKSRWLLVAGVVSLLMALAIGWSGLCPIVKRIWTPSWVLFSGGICFLALAFFFSIVDGWGWRKWGFYFKVIGANSIVAYFMEWIPFGIFSDALRRHLGPPTFEVFGREYAPLVLGFLVFQIAWLILYWMYRRGIFIKI